MLHDTPENDLCISNAKFNIHKPIKFYITYSARKETIGHLTMDVNVTFKEIIWVKKRSSNILKMLVTIDNTAVFIWSTL